MEEPKIIKALPTLSRTPTSGTTFGSSGTALSPINSPKLVASATQVELAKLAPPSSRLRLESAIHRTDPPAPPAEEPPKVAPVQTSEDITAPPYTTLLVTIPKAVLIAQQCITGVEVNPFNIETRLLSIDFDADVSKVLVRNISAAPVVFNLVWV